VGDPDDHRVNRPVKILILLALAAAVALALYWLARPRRPAPKSVTALRRELERMTADPAVADRLVARMRRRHPNASTARLYQLAIAELKADRR
jgi:hypothetical protein